MGTWSSGEASFGSKFFWVLLETALLKHISNIHARTAVSLYQSFSEANRSYSKWDSSFHTNGKIGAQKRSGGPSSGPDVAKDKGQQFDSPI